MNNVSIPYNDIKLWDEFRRGNKQSFEKLIQTHYRSLFTYATKFTKDVEFAKDCLQEVFLDLWRTRANISSTNYVKSYLFKSVRNKVCRELQKNAWHHNAEQINDEYYFDVQLSIEHHLIREQALRDTANKFSELLDKLPKRQKEIIYLRFYQNLEVSEIVEIMNITPQSVYNLLNKALSNLRDPGLARLNYK